MTYAEVHSLLEQIRDYRKSVEQVKIQLNRQLDDIAVLTHLERVQLNESPALRKIRAKAERSAELLKAQLGGYYDIEAELSAAIRSLDTQSQTVIWLYYINACTNVKISMTLPCCDKTVVRMKHRAIQAITEYINQDQEKRGAI